MSIQVWAVESPTLELITFGPGGRFSQHDIDKASALLEADDLERFAAGRQQMQLPAWTDSDFARFPGLRWRHPLAAA